LRLLQLRVGSGLLDLHPHVSVVQGTSGEDRATLARVVDGLARARAEGEGLLEAHGVMFPLDPDLVAQIDPRQHDLEPVVRPADLPGPVGDVADLAAREVAFRALLDRLALAVEAHTDATAALDEVVAERKRARTRVTRARAAIDAAEPGADAEPLGAPSPDLQEALAALEARRADLEARLDDGAAAAFAAASARWRALQAAPATAADAGGGPDQADAHSPPTGGDGSEDEAATRRLLVVEELLAELAAVDPEPVRAALIVARSRAEQQVPVPEAIALAEAIEALDAEIADAEAAGVPVLTDADRAVSERLERARIAVADAESAARDLALDPADVAALEAAHDALLAALDRAERRFATPRARKQVEAARAAEQAVLDRLGLVSYTDYLMGTSRRHRRPAAEAALQAARAELAAAERAWDEVAARHALVLAHAERLERRRELVAQAYCLLGQDVPDDELGSALRALRAPAPVAPVIVDDLVAALEAAGVDLGTGPHDLDDVVLVAEAWLAEADRAGERSAELTAEREALLAAADPPTPAASAAGDLPGAPAAVADLEAARREATAALEQAEQRHQAHRDALDALAALDAELERARAAAQALAAPGPETGTSAAQRALEDAQATLAEVEERHRALTERCDALAREVEVLEAEGRAAAADLEALQDSLADADPVRADRDQLEWFLMAKVAAQRATSLAGSTPLLVEDPFPGLDDHDVGHLLDQLERLADTVQVILLSGAPGVAAWAEGVGEARAAVVRPQR